MTTQAQSQPTQSFQQSGVQTHQVHANQLPEQVTQIFVSKMNIKQINGVHEAKLVLNPQSLGQVDVTIKSHNGVITAQFHAETQAAKDMLDNQLPQLRAALTQQGLQVDRLGPTVLWTVGGIAALALATVAFLLVRRRSQAKQQQENEDVQDLLTPSQSLDVPDLIYQEDGDQVMVRKQLEKLARSKPDEFVVLLRTWLAED